MLIGLVGLKRSGKDTTADYLVEKFGFTKSNFADPIRQFIEQQFGLPIAEQLAAKDTPNRKLGYKTPRQVMRILGEAYRSVDPNFWINKTLVKYDMHPGKNFVIADVRLPSEVKAILDAGGYLWYIKRRKMSVVQKMIHATFAHETERYVPGMEKFCDTTLCNYGSIDDLKVLIGGEMLLLKVRECNNPIIQ